MQCPICDGTGNIVAIPRDITTLREEQCDHRDGRGVVEQNINNKNIPA
jgi:hypothetical protein